MRNNSVETEIEPCRTPQNHISLQEKTNRFFPYVTRPSRPSEKKNRVDVAQQRFRTVSKRLRLPRKSSVTDSYSRENYPLVKRNLGLENKELLRKNRRQLA